MRYAASIVATAVTMADPRPWRNGQRRRQMVAGEISTISIPDRRKSPNIRRSKKPPKPWNICVLFPHMKDTFWVAVDYGVVEEARADGREHDALRGRRL